MSRKFWAFPLIEQETIGNTSLRFEKNFVDIQLTVKRGETLEQLCVHELGRAWIQGFEFAQHRQVIYESLLSKHNTSQNFDLVMPELNGAWVEAAWPPITFDSWSREH